MNAASPPASATPAPGPMEPLAESVAGEEDPGASIDMAMAARGQGACQAPAPPPPPAPGDAAPAGSPGTGEAVCPHCGGSGRLDAAACPNCGGTGKVVQGIGGG